MSIKISDVIGNIDVDKRHELGAVTTDKDGNNYVYLEGVVNTVQYSVVTYDEAYATALATANAVGPVAVAQAAVVASRYGWYMIKGTTNAKCVAAVADNKTLSLTSTAGSIDDADASGDAITGMWSRAAATGAGTVAVQLDYPKVHDIAID